jgi:hypothetical protein
MDAYVLGRSEGDLPTHLFEGGEPGNRVRAMAQLDGPDHNAFYAIEGPDAAAVDQHVQSITAAGSTAAVTITPPDGPAEDPDWVMIGIIVHPSHMPPWVYYWLHHIPNPPDPPFESDELANAVRAVRDILGEEGIAAIKGRDGDILIEFGADDQAKLDEARAAFGAHLGDNHSGGHAVTGAGIVKA